MTMLETRERSVTPGRDPSGGWAAIPTVPLTGLIGSPKKSSRRTAVGRLYRVVFTCLLFAGGGLALTACAMQPETVSAADVTDFVDRAARADALADAPKVRAKDVTNFLEGQAKADEIAETEVDKLGKPLRPAEDIVMMQAHPGWSKDKRRAQWNAMDGGERKRLMAEYAEAAEKKTQRLLEDMDIRRCFAPDEAPGEAEKRLMLLAETKHRVDYGTGGGGGGC